MRSLFLSAVLGLIWLATVGTVPGHAQAVYWRRAALNYDYPPAYYYPPDISYYPRAGYVSYYATPAYTSYYYFPSYYAPTYRGYDYAQPVYAPGYPGYYNAPWGYYGSASPAYDFWSGHYYGR